MAAWIVEGGKEVDAVDVIGGGQIGNGYLHSILCLCVVNALCIPSNVSQLGRIILIWCLSAAGCDLWSDPMTGKLLAMSQN